MIRTGMKQSCGGCGGGTPFRIEPSWSGQAVNVRERGLRSARSKPRVLGFRDHRTSSPREMVPGADGVYARNPDQPRDCAVVAEERR